MKPTSVALLCLPFLLVLIHLTLAKRGTSSGGRSSTNRGTSTTSNRGNTNSGKKPTKVAQPQPGSSYPKKADSNQGRPTTNQYGYPQQGWGAGRPNQPQAGGYGGGYPGGQLNYNPSNKILSPGYAGSYGYGGHGGAGGSPYSRSVQGMGYGPSSRSREFGRGVVIAAGAGVITGMALGYGLGRFPRPPSHFQSPHDERYYNHYMYQTYGRRSTDENDYSRDYVFSPPSFSKHMNTCMKRQDLLPTVKTPSSPIIPMATDNGRGKKTMESNDTLGSKNTLGSNNTVSPNQTNKPTANPLPPASKDPRLDDGDEGDDDTVSIVDIGYPALIDQLKTRSCVKMYIVIADGYLKKRGSLLDGVAQGAGRGLQQVLAVVVGTLLSLASCN